MAGLSCSMWALSCSMWDLVPQRGIEPGPSALGVQSLTHWTTREVPLRWLLEFHQVLRWWTFQREELECWDLGRVAHGFLALSLIAFSQTLCSAAALRCSFESCLPLCYLLFVFLWWVKNILKSGQTQKFVTQFGLKKSQWLFLHLENCDILALDRFKLFKILNNILLRCETWTNHLKKFLIN